MPKKTITTHVKETLDNFKEATKDVVGFSPNITAIHHDTVNNQIQIDFDNGTFTTFPTTSEEYAEFEKCFSFRDWQKRANAYYANNFS